MNSKGGIKDNLDDIRNNVRENVNEIKDKTLNNAENRTNMFKEGAKTAKDTMEAKMKSNFN